MARNVPRIGDFVLWEDEIWFIRKADPSKNIVYIEGVSLEDEDHLLADSLVPTDIKVWGTEGEPEPED